MYLLKYPFIRTFIRTLSHANLEQPFRTLAIKREVNVVKEVFLHLCLASSFMRLSFCVRLSLLLLSRYDTANEYITTFQATNKRNFIRENLKMTEKRKSKERNWILFDSSTINAMKTTCIKERIDKTQRNSRCTYSDRDETVNHMISECSK